MLHIFRADNGEERSLHADTLEGLANARSEAWLRSANTGVVHHIVDDEGQVVGIMDANHRPKLDSVARKVVKPWKVPPAIFFWTALFMAMVIFRAVFGKEVF